jgi:hypothetical protein
MAARRGVFSCLNLYSKDIAMRQIAMIVSVVLTCLPTAVMAQASGAAPDMPPAPIGHLQPRPTTPPTVTDKDSSGSLTKDDPARLDQELQPSTDRAIHSLCSYCLKPEGSKKQR